MVDVYGARVVRAGSGRSPSGVGLTRRSRASAAGIYFHPLVLLSCTYITSATQLVKPNSSGLWWVKLGPSRIHIPWLAMLFPFAYLLAGGAYKTVRQGQLARTGLSAKALVLTEPYIGMRGITGYYYRFSANGQLYMGHTLSQPGYIPGDTIQVVYLPADPHINYDLQFLQERYSISSPAIGR